ncbi:MAG: 2-hydroxyacyl-CoA dehydratase [Clostridiales bacterium]
MVGFTTSVPIEVILAANCKPVDLNNIFISDKNSDILLEKAETKGFPRNTCSWIKGIYSVIKSNKEINKVINVVEGDCSNTKALMEVLEYDGIECISFAYPKKRDYLLMKSEIENLCKYLNVSIEKANLMKKKLYQIRKDIKYFDELTWKHNKVNGFENHYWLVSSSDYFGDILTYSELLKAAIKKAENSKSLDERVRLGYIGVPPIFNDIYEVVESFDARVVFNEVQRQFTMYDSNDENDIVKEYLNYTYPYDLKARLLDIKEQIKKREINGIIHYTQSFCFRGIEDILIRKNLDVPILTIEGDRPGKIDARTKLRIEAFIDMLNE